MRNRISIKVFRAVLVEKKLDTDRLKWTKWNDNNGTVDGMIKHLPIDVDFELRQLNQQQQPQVNDLGAIAECDENSDDESVSDVEESQDNVKDDYDNGSEMTNGINPSEYLQAFTHFTYRFTNKRVMVCDLQGVFDTDTVPPTIELTDPAIHYASSKGRRMVYGRTDKGKTGVNAFFKVLLWFCIAIYNTSSHELIQMILPSPCAFYVYQFRHTNAPRYASTCIYLEGTRNGKTTGDKKVLKA